MQVSSRSLRLMGTIIETKIWHPEAEPILDQVEELLYLYKDRFSANDLTSELMEVNLNAGVQAVPIADDLYELIKLGKEHSLAQGSFLNITIGPLVQSWRIGFSDAKLPSPEVISEKLQLINPRDIELDDREQTVYLKKEGMAIDLGALAKGYVADRIVDFLKRIGVEAGLINLGGNVLTFGQAPHNPDGCWRIGIQDPQKARGENALVLKIGEESVVTSGIYERSLTVDGQTYHHILSSQTGYPIQSQLASVTIVSKQSVDGEIWTTRLFGQAIDQIIKVVEDTDGIEVVLIGLDRKIFVTSGLTEKILAGRERISDSLGSPSRGGFGARVTSDLASGASVL
ncbi:FAD:protein FMN transferase [Streptococcus iners]|uniref:FAD:protein FMN transferase n=1 Tax=Streptococcus iners subsp. hyiners TaxID=3028083 RepID=A0AA96VH48_9STRE|nr:FAD:protein FMN transferase [Streptococcus sp. 29892]MCK4029254.1 FAD:protein FMN transferase [Streptococcus suis]WNY49717.1 FAD:protein FMN transferase [Streptococcus sp. 29892]